MRAPAGCLSRAPPSRRVGVAAKGCRCDFKGKHFSPLAAGWARGGASWRRMRAPAGCPPPARRPAARASGWRPRGIVVMSPPQFLFPLCTRSRSSGVRIGCGHQLVKLYPQSVHLLKANTSPLTATKPAAVREALPDAPAQLTRPACRTPHAAVPARSTCPPPSRTLHSSRTVSQLSPLLPPLNSELYSELGPLTLHSVSEL